MSVFRALYAIFSKIGRFAPEKVVLNLIRTEYYPVWCRIVSNAYTRQKSIEFTVTRSFMQLFKTGSTTVVSDCRKFFRVLPVTYHIDVRTANI